MKTSTKIIIAVVILAFIAVAFFFGMKFRKEKLVDKIFELNPTLDEDRADLMKMDFDQLRALIETYQGKP